ncbi:hypothetical protein PoB_002932800 [Plakobranchus ocellatus]|uniref:Uncharacterized protein n=1 Tax=Plakobranchus ocellatus TaxID=259542 RepID=A0AAV4A7W8_9GAST|nr:hypothetical protein PoB_002932800 [Plakobranchus ocellatus]
MRNNFFYGTQPHGIGTPAMTCSVKQRQSVFALVRKHWIASLLSSTSRKTQPCRFHKIWRVFHQHNTERLSRVLRYRGSTPDSVEKVSAATLRCVSSDCLLIICAEIQASNQPPGQPQGTQGHNQNDVLKLEIIVPIWISFHRCDRRERNNGGAGAVIFSTCDKWSSPS